MEDPNELTSSGSLIPYVVAAVVVLLIGIGAIMGVFLTRPEKDNTAIIAIIVSAITPTSAGILALMKAQETHLVVNSRFEKVISAARIIARQEGIDEEKSRRDILAIAIASPAKVTQADLTKIGE